MTRITGVFFFLNYQLLQSSAIQFSVSLFYYGNVSKGVREKNTLMFLKGPENRSK